MRKQINALSVYVEETLDNSSLSGDLYIFLWEDQKVNENTILGQDKFQWPLDEEEVKEITADELSMLLDGIDFWNAYKILKFSSVS